MRTDLQNPCTQEEFNAYYQFQRLQSNHILFRTKHLKCNILKGIISLFPVLNWLPLYEIKKDLAKDLQAGFTIAILHIPQGMGYAALGGVHPIVGIYMAIFPVLVYFLMGTSRHISMGSFSIICLMAGKPVSEYSNTLAPIEVATVISLVVGIVQVVLGFCKVGSLSMFMSESLIKGFTTGAAILVGVSQLGHVFGVKLANHFGIFNAVYTVSDFFQTVSRTNYLSLGISLSVIAILTVYIDLLKPKLKCRYVLPMELVILVFGTAVSYIFDLKSQYSINIIGDIPTGFPFPSIPHIQLIPDVLVDSILIAVVSFSIQVAMASMFTMKDNYTIDPSQELIASGFANIFGSFFSCLPVGVSLSRSVIQFSSGGKTQLASIFSSLFLLLVILYFGKFLEPLPYAVLAGIVIAYLKGIVGQAKDLLRIWKYSFYDGIIWLTTFLSVVFLDIGVGLAISFILSLLYIIILNQNVYVCILGRVPGTNLFLETQRYQMAELVPNFIIMQIQAGLHFANIHLAMNKIENVIQGCLTNCNKMTLVIDMSTVMYIDPEALQALKNYILNLKKKDFNVVLARLTGRVYEEMRNCDFFNDISDHEIFQSIEDAVSTYNIEQSTYNAQEV